MFLARAALLIVLIIAASVADASATTDARLPIDATPEHYALHLTIDPRAERFTGEARIRVRLANAADAIRLHAEQIEITSTRVTLADGSAFDATTEIGGEGSLDVRFGRRVAAQKLELTFTYGASFNRQLEGLYKVTVGDDSYAVTQMEPVSARHAFPCFDEPRFKTPFDISLTVPEADVGVANTVQKSAEVSADKKWKTLQFATTRPLPTYLVAFAVGPWDVVAAPPIPPNAVRANPLPLRGIGPRGSAKRLAWVLARTPSMVKFYEDYTAQPYPFDKLDLLGAPDFPAGAMENAGLIVFRDSLLLLDAQSSADRYRAAFDVVAHEIAHQWFGDLVTVPWWDDIWLNEACATWAQAKATAVLQPDYHAPLTALEARIAAMADDSLSSARKVRQPIGGRGDIEAAFDGITYEKGAALLSMVERWVGDDVFRSGMRAYLAQHAFGSGSAADLIATLAGTSGKGATLARAMHGFLDQPGVPLIRVATTCHRNEGTLTLAQSRYLPYGTRSNAGERWSVPVCARIGRGGSSGVQCFLLEKASQDFAMDGGCPDWIMPNADARGYYRFELAADAQQRLAAVVPQRSALEQLSYADSIVSAFVRGTLASSAVLDAMPQLASSDEPQVATALFATFAWIREHLADAAQRTSLDVYAQRLYTPRLAQLGLHRRDGEAATVGALRARLADFLAMTVREPDVRADIGRQGRAALGIDDGSRPDLSRADPDVRDTALAVAVQDGGVAAFDAALQALAASHDTAERYALLAALGASRDPVLATRARDLGLTDAVQIGEMASVYATQMAEPENRDAAWTWLQANFDAYLARLPSSEQAGLPDSFAQGRCGGADADVMSAFYVPRIDRLTGGARGLARTIERVRQCGALRDHGPSSDLGAWIERRAGVP